MQGTTTPMYI